MKHYLTLFLIIMTISPSPAGGQSLLDKLPSPPAGWESVQSDKIYTPETLYDYIDGGAELYISYDMKEVASRIIAQGDNEIRIEVFDMQEARNAFGVFSHTRTKDEKQYGQGSQYFPGALIFWKSNYYIALTANDVNETIVKALHTLAGDIDQKISHEGSLPEVIEKLPQTGLEKDGFVYFHHYIWINSFYFISSENLFNINTSTSAVLAKYGTKEDRYYLLLIRYPEKDAAVKAYSQFVGEVFSDPENTLEQLEDNTWAGSLQPDNYIIAVFNAASGKQVEKLLQETIANIKN